MSLLFKGLITHPSEANLVVTVCWALSNLINAGQAPPLLMASQMTAVGAALEKHFEDPRCRDYVCRTAAELTRGHSEAARRNRQGFRQLAPRVCELAQHGAQKANHAGGTARGGGSLLANSGRREQRKTSKTSSASGW